MSSPEVRTAGPLALFRKASRVLAHMGDPEQLPVYRTAFVNPRMNQVRLPTGVTGLGRGLEGRRVPNTVMGGVHLEDSYVYRVPPRGKRAAA
jgi:hypothetical protein